MLCIAFPQALLCVALLCCGCMLHKTKGLQAKAPTSIARHLCELVGTIPPPRKSPKRYILSTEESERLRSYLLDYVQADPPNSPETTFIVSIAQIAAEHKRVILTERELKNVEEILTFSPRSKEAI